MYEVVCKEPINTSLLAYVIGVDDEVIALFDTEQEMEDGDYIALVPMDNVAYIRKVDRAIQ